MINKTAERLFIAMIVSILAVMAVCFAETQESYAADEYKYKITVYAGEHGTFGGNRVWTKEFDYGEHVRIDFETLNFQMNKGSKYYNLGFRVTGHDNDEADGVQSMEFDVKEDLSYEVAYRIKGDMVSYTIKYVDSESGKELHDPDTYYGMVGDKPVVSYRYIKDYEPQAYNITGKLQRDESKNVWTFEYAKEGTQQNQQNQQNQNNPNANPANPGPAAPGTPANPAGTNVNPDPGTENIGDTDTPTDAGDQGGNKPQQTQDLDDSEKPTASPFDNAVAIAVGTGLGVFLLLLLIWLYLMKRKNKEKFEE